MIKKKVHGPFQRLSVAVQFFFFKSSTSYILLIETATAATLQLREPARSGAAD